MHPRNHQRRESQKVQLQPPASLPGKEVHPRSTADSMGVLASAGVWGFPEPQLTAAETAS